MWMESILHFPYISYKFCLFTAMTMSQVSVSCQCFPGPRSPSSKQVGPWPFGAQTWLHSRENPWTKRRFTAVIVLRTVAGGFSRTPCLFTGWCFGRIPNYHRCVCVCEIRYRMRNDLVYQLIQQGVDAWSGSHPPTKTLPFHGDIDLGRQIDVPANLQISFNCWSSCYTALFRIYTQDFRWHT